MKRSVTDRYHALPTVIIPPLYPPLTPGNAVTLALTCGTAAASRSLRAWEGSGTVKAPRP